MTDHNDICGAFNCQQQTAIVIWKVPLCKHHWDECCARDQGCSIVWLRRNTRNEYKSKFEQYSALVDKLFYKVHKLRLASEQLMNKVRHMVPYTEKHVENHNDLLAESINKVAKLDEFIQQVDDKLKAVVNEVDAQLHAAFIREERQQNALRAQEENAPAFFSRGMQEAKPRAVKEPSKPKFSLAAALAKKPQ